MKVSVIIPCYNVEDYIEECLDSVFNQDYQDIEVICIDNNSNDKTWDIIQKVKKEKYTGIVIESEFKEGAPAARNKGINLSHGTWLQFLDADDLLLPCKISNQIKTLLKESNSSVVIGNYCKNKLDGSIQNNVVNRDIWKGLFATELGITSSNLYKSSEVKKVGKWDENYNSSQESKLLFEILKNGNSLSFCAEEDTMIRERKSGQISSTNLKGKWETYIQLRIDIFVYLQEHKKEYFNKTKDYYKSKLFLYFQILSKYNSSLSARNYLNYLGGKYQPKEMGKVKRLMYKTLGFNGANSLINFLKK